MMPTQNPEYDPKWEAKAKQAWSDLQDVEQKLEKARTEHRAMSKGTYRPEQWREINSDLENLQEEQQKFHAQHQHFISVAAKETIQEYVEWACNFFNPTNDTLADPKEIENLTTLEDAHTYIFQITEKRNQALTNFYTPAAKTNHPEGVNAFKSNDAGHSDFISRNNTWLTFTADEMPEARAMNLEMLSFHIVIEKRNDGDHICFTENGSEAGNIGVTNRIEELATKIAKRLQSLNTPQNLSDCFKAIIPGRNTKSDQNFSFYIYTPHDSKFAAGTFMSVQMNKTITGYKNAQFRHHECAPEGIIEAYDTRRAAPRTSFSDAHVERSIKDPQKTNGPLAQEYLYKHLAIEWNALEATYRDRLTSIVDDYLYLEANKGHEPRRALNVLRDISTEFDTYAINTVAAYHKVYGLNMTGSHEGINDAIKAVRNKYGKIRKCSSKIDKLLKTFTAFGYPVDEFNSMEEAHFKIWAEENNYEGVTSSDFMNHLSYGRKLPEDLVRYMHAMEEMIICRNLIEHTDALNNGILYRPKKLKAYMPHANENEKVRIADIDIMRYASATSTFMNHLKRAVDYHASTMNITEAKQNKVKSTPKLVTALTEDYMRSSLIGSIHDPILLSAINFTPTFSEDELIHAANGQSHNGSKQKAMLTKWITLCEKQNSETPYTPYIPEINIG